MSILAWIFWNKRPLCRTDFNTDSSEVTEREDFQCEFQCSGAIVDCFLTKIHECTGRHVLFQRQFQGGRREMQSFHQFVFRFHAFFGKNGRLIYGLAPPSGNSSILHCACSCYWSFQQTCFDLQWMVSIFLWVIFCSLFARYYTSIFIKKLENNKKVHFLLKCETLNEEMKWRKVYSVTKTVFFLSLQWYSLSLQQILYFLPSLNCLID